MSENMRAPHDGEWIRVNPDPQQRKEVMLVYDGGEPYLIDEPMVEKIRERWPERLVPTMMFVAGNDHGEIFLWPVRSPITEEHIAFRAMREWVCYQVLQ